MGHTIRNKTKLVNRVRRIRGQIDAIDRALEKEAPCGSVLQLIAAARGAINGLMSEVLEQHVRGHVLAPAREREAATEELVDVIRTYVR